MVCFSTEFTVGPTSHGSVYNLLYAMINPAFFLSLADQQGFSRVVAAGLTDSVNRGELLRT